MSVRKLALPLAAALALAACATGSSGIDVKRFHLDQPISRGTIALVPGNPAEAGSLEFGTYAAAVANELRAQGFQPVEASAGPAYTGTLTITQNVQVGPPRSSGLSIGIGGGGFSGGRRGGGGVGLGGGVSFPVGKAKRDAVEIDALTLQIKRRADSALIWEGSATTAIDTRSAQATLANAVPAMARALLAGFPGQSGVTQNVKSR